MNTALRLLALVAVVLPLQAAATNAGWRRIDVPGLTPQAPPIPVALYYPTEAPERPTAMGPFSVRAAIQAVPVPAFKGLIVLSHGTGGSELGHGRLAETLARHGYLVAALRHPGDNWQDRSLRDSAPRYFGERPQHAARVIDALLADPAWGGRVTRDAQGPRVGALGHSAGGYTVLALAGGEPDVARLSAHCAQHRAEDPIFCGLGQPAAPPATSPPPLRDRRVRAVVALAPVGVVFSATSLATVQVPAAIHVAEHDRFVVPRFHADWIARHLRGAVLHRVPGAWHFAFIDRPGTPILTEDGDIGADPPGFDRPAFLDALGAQLVRFFDDALR